MSGLILAGQQQRASIVVQTRCGTPVDNVQEANLTLFYQAQSRQQMTRHAGPGVVFRINESGYYNCHGLTFAARRTAIPDPQEVAKIIREDGYKAVLRSDVVVGDIALYMSKDDIEHSATVVAVENLHVRVLSKWGMGPEVVHWLHQGPYDAADVRFYRVMR